MIEYARTSEDRRDWPQAEARWRTLTQSVDASFVFAAHARSLIELGRLDEAEQILERKHAVFPADFDIGLTRCRLAERRGDTEAACERWASLQRVQPYFKEAYSARARCLVNVERHAEADTVMSGAIERFPKDDWPLLEFANLAHRRLDWDAAVSRWEAFRVRFPERDEGYVNVLAALEASGRHEEAIALRR